MGSVFFWMNSTQDKLKLKKILINIWYLIYSHWIYPLNCDKLKQFADGKKNLETYGLR